MISLKNDNCIYCGSRFDSKSDRTQEHVIGRRFVPKGKLQLSWNLIARACQTCNLQKADLENDISAITLYPDPATHPGRSDNDLHIEVNRKLSGSQSRKTGKPVWASVENATYSFPLGPGVITFNMTAPPQADEQRLGQLAMFHVQAFYYLMTYKNETKTGSLLPGIFVPVAAARASDWGSEQMRAFTNVIDGWKRHVHAIGADSFFKLVVRRAKCTEVWAWAVEWNMSYRLVGFFGKENLVREHESLLPSMQLSQHIDLEGKHMYCRPEQSIEESDDLLFRK